jgi:hypothetical protein
LKIAAEFAACVFAVCSLSHAQPFTFDDVDFWVGSGANRAAMAIDWNREGDDPPAMVWGYCWDGTAFGSDMLLAIVAADDRLYVKLGIQADELRVYGLGYDANNDGQFALNDGGFTQFDEDGIAYGSAPFNGRPALDTADFYTEGWEFEFWHYGVGIGNPFDGGHWLSSPLGIVKRQLVDGVWDGWAFQDRDEPPFDAYPVDPIAAPSPYPPGDFNHDTFVDELDYALWKTNFGSTNHHALDANGNGIVDAADYTIWRNNCCNTGAAALESAAGVPEPATVVLLITTGFLIYSIGSRQRKE